MSDEIKQFVKDYIEQDNCITAWPYAYVVQARNDVPAFEGCGTIELYGCRQHDFYDYSTRKELEDVLKEHGYEDFDDLIFQYDMTEAWDDKQWFFTQKGAENHLKQNSHNYRETRLYVKHMFRHNEAEMILRNLFSIAGED